MIRAGGKRNIRRIITFLIVVGNTIGAILTYLYFSNIHQIYQTQQNLPLYYDDLFFVIGTGVLIFVFVWIMRRSSFRLYQVANDEVSIGSMDSATAQTLKRKAIQLPSVSAGVGFLVWILAGFIFSFLQPVISQILYGVDPDLIECLKMFFGITCIGGSITALFIYFTIEKHWREAMPKFFPEGDLSQVKDAFKLHVHARLLIVFVAISSVPLPLLGIAAYTKAQALHKADAIVRAQLLSSLFVEIIVITAICVAASIVLSTFVSKSVSIPLDKLENAMKEVEKGNLDVRVEIVSNDEIGSVAEGFNIMVKGLKESESIKDSFGKYVSQEIRDEILYGRVSLDGEMKRVTLLFSDLRNFTPFVESTHPKQVITIMNQYFTQMTEAIKENRGLVLQYVGDEIEAVFGAPVSYDDHTDMAVEAALGMRSRLTVLNQSLERNGFSPFQHGIGIHTGAVLAGNIGSNDRISYALVGDTVNLASRIGGLTKKFSCDIILSQTTHDLLTGTFLTEQLSSVTVKGKKEGVMIYKLLDHA
jgi:adenylate cyclase